MPLFIGALCYKETSCNYGGFFNLCSVELSLREMRVVYAKLKPLK